MMGNKDAEIKSAWDFFPELFVKEKQLADEMRKESEIQRIVNSRYNFAAAHNRALREREEKEDVSECSNTADAAGSDPG